MSNSSNSTPALLDLTTEQPWGWPWWGWFIFTVCCLVFVASIAGALIAGNPTRKQGEFHLLQGEEDELESEEDEETSVEPE
mmetsp:Transcript_19408/g.45139  ORF Transcript_19408/g.45139 Transcript_19408/m.45139 type:complete len:81 (+) Transcript_19408:101-343(+)